MTVEEFVATLERDYKNGFTYISSENLISLIADWRKRGEVLEFIESREQMADAAAVYEHADVIAEARKADLLPVRKKSDDC